MTPHVATVAPSAPALTDLPRQLPLPGSAPAYVAVPAPGAGPQRWAGAPSAALDDDGTVVLAYRRRTSFAEDRNVLARSADGARFETVVELDKERWGFAMVERPALVRDPGGGWRLYVCGSDPVTGVWSVGLLEAREPEGLADAELALVLPGGPATTVKDPVVRHDGRRWHAWLCHHPLADPDAQDRMTTAYATSDDGRAWTVHGTVLAGTPGTWDARGTRLTAVLPGGYATYDGRASAQENWRERTGLAAPARGPAGRGAGHRGLQALPAGPVADARYLDVLRLPDGVTLLYYEAPLPDESHELRVERLEQAERVSDA